MKYASIITFVFLFAAASANVQRPADILKSQNADDIAKIPEHKTQYNKSGVEEHISFSAYSDGQKATRKFVRKMLVDGLREQFSTWKKGFTQFADDEGFVRQGIVYCGSDKHTNTFPTDFSTETGSLVEADGYGQEFNETEVCSRRNADGVMEDQCAEGSVVATLAKTIRAMGLNIHHQDVCDAVIFDTDTIFPTTFTTTLQPYGAAPSGCGVNCADETQRYEHACTSKEEGGDGAHFVRTKENCFGLTKDKCPGTNCLFFDRENTCFAKESGEDAPSGCDSPAWGEISKNTAKNAVRRSTSYGVTKLNVENTDYAYVTGCNKDELVEKENIYAGALDATTGQPLGAKQNVSKCGNLRSLFLALNGNTQINAFRDLGINEAGEHWGKKVSEIKAYLVDFAYQLTNFRPISLEIFPFIENEVIEGCPMGTTEYVEDTTGDEEEPLCYKQSLTFEQLLKMDKTGQAFSRTHCFCRNGQLDDYNYAKAERDDLYLLTDLGEEEERCGDSNNAVTMPISAYAYCKQIDAMGDTPYWKNTLESLRPPATEARTKIYSHNPTEVLNRRAEIRQRLENTFTTELDNSCGRIVNADSRTKADPSKLMRSNKGGNCMPFGKLNEVLFRLEFETGVKDMGEYSDEDDLMMEDVTLSDGYEMRFVKPSTDAGVSDAKFHDFFCRSASFAEKAYSFRQLAYRWDRAQVGEVEVPVADSDGAVAWYEKYDGTLDGLDRRYTSRYVVDGAVVAATEQNEPRSAAEFCHPDWITQIGGDIGREDSTGYRWSNPYPLLELEIDEAIFNTKLAAASKTIVKIQQNDLWNFIEEQLTENREGNIVEQLGNRAGKHFMKIWLDENTE